MPELYDFDDRTYIKRYDRTRNSFATLLIPLLLIPIAFLAGWITNAYTGNENLNRVLPGIEVGVGGGPDKNEIISPLPTNGPSNQTVSPTVTPTVSITPTTVPTMPTQ